MIRRVPSRAATASFLALLVGFSASSSWAQSGPGLEVAPERRHVAEDEASPPPEKKPAAATPAAPTPSASQAVPTHKKGRAPKTPAAELPADVPLAVADPSLRRSIAEGPTSEETRQGASDTELNLLRDAEAALFPTAVRGIEPGWSWDLPRARDPEGDALGLPLRAQGPGGEISKSDSEWLRSLTLPDLPVRLDQRVVTYLKFYRDSPRGRTIAAIWAKKSGRYVSSMKAEMRRAGLPTDLVWLSMIESGHNPSIESPVGAVGLWQFMPQSGRMYGLTVDKWVDERRDPARSTQAAVRLLSDLRERFGNWELAMAAYNMGYAGLSKSIGKYNTNDYWALSRLEGGIPWETTLYVPKIFALAIVMNNREAFGLGKIQADPAVSFDTILVEPGAPWPDVAKAAKTSEQELKSLNPQYVAERLPPTAGSEPKWAVRVPRGKGTEALAALSGRTTSKFDTIVARFGEDPSSLSSDYGGRETDWMRENQLDKDERIDAGTVLIVPRGAQSKPVSKPTPELVVSRPVEVGAGQELVFYEVRSGDDLEEIAASFQVSARDLTRWNSLDDQARLRDGMMLQLIVPKDRDLGFVRHVRAGAATILVAGSPEFHEHFEGLGGKNRVAIVVRHGDTLASIGSRYGMSVGSMERVNRRSRSTKLVPGETLVVYTDRAKSSAASTGNPAPLDPLTPPRPELIEPAPAGGAASAPAASGR